MHIYSLNGQSKRAVFYTLLNCFGVMGSLQDVSSTLRGTRKMCTLGHFIIVLVCFFRATSCWFGFALLAQ